MRLSPMDAQPGKGRHDNRGRLQSPNRLQKVTCLRYSPLVVRSGRRLLRFARRRDSDLFLGGRFLTAVKGGSRPVVMVLLVSPLCGLKAARR